jgi:hypothetical protein
MFVRSNHRKSYTNRPELADKYDTYSQALKNCCDNESVMKVISHND